MAPSSRSPGQPGSAASGRGLRLHWQILAALVLGVLAGAVLQALEAAPWIGARFAPDGPGALLAAVEPGSPAAEARLAAGDRITSLVVERGRAGQERTVPVGGPEDVAATLAGLEVGAVLWVATERAPRPVPVAVAMDPGSTRATWLAPFVFLADIFMALLKMLIVPIILTSVITGVTGVGSGRDLGRLSAKTFAYYVLTSLLAVLVGQLLVNVIRPGEGALLGLNPADASVQAAVDQSLWDVLKRMVPSNVFTAFSDNGQMLQVIFFALLFGFFVLKTAEPHRERIRSFFESAFEVMMTMAGAVLALVPLGVFFLLAKVIGQTGFGLFGPLGLYMLTVTLGLLLHAGVTLPLLLKLVGRVNPLRWLHAMGPALMTAVSTSSSSMTLPVTLETVERRGRVSNKTTSFVLPLGATINMDGTALYECVGVIFLAQYYAGVGEFTLTMAMQVKVVVMALLASVGAAGIPSAGLIMMLTILGALGLPVEGAALLLAVDRPLDMLRTAVNVWSDSCCAALVATSEGEVPLATEGVVVDTG